MTWPLTIMVHFVQLCTIIVIAWYLAKRKLQQPYLFFTIGWSLILLHDLTMVVIGLISKPVSNHWVYNIAFIFQYLLIIWFFAKINKQKLYTGFVLLYGIFAFINLFCLQGKSTLNTYSLAAGGIVVFVLAVLKMYELNKEETSESLFSEPDFWYCTGFILYCALAVPYFAMFNYLLQNFQKFTTVYFFTLSYGFVVLLNLCIIKGLLCYRTVTK